MNTIQFIIASIEKMNALQIPAQIEVGTFKVSGNWAGRYNYSQIKFKIKFRLNFRPDHIQKLIELGVTIDFPSVVMADLSPKAKRFKAGRDAIRQGRYAPYYYEGDPANRQTGVIENWLNADASCNSLTLSALDNFCRDNHHNEIAIHNDTSLKGCGWRFKIKYPSGIAIESQYKNIKAIRKTAIGTPANKLLPIQKRVIKLR